MAAEWGEVTDFERDNYVKQNGGDVDTIQAAITFSFFAILVWVSICVCACVRTCVCMRACTCACVHACMCLSVCICVVCTYTYALFFTQTKQQYYGQVFFINVDSWSCGTHKLVRRGAGEVAEAYW